MQRILIVGLPDRLAGWLAQRLPGVAVEVAWSGADAIAVLEDGGWAALIIDAAVSDVPTERVIRAARARGGAERVPVILTLDPGERGPDEDAVRNLVTTLGVDRVLLAPLDRGELARHLGALVQAEREAAPAREKPDAPVGNAPPETLSAALTAVWERALPTIMGRIDAIDRAVSSMLTTGSMPRETRETAEREAHRLAGALGTFGSHEGTRLARLIENGLSPHAPVGRDIGGRIAQLVTALRAEVDARAATAHGSAPAPASPAAAPAPAPAAAPAVATPPATDVPTRAAAPAAEPPAAATVAEGAAGGAVLVVLTDDAALAQALGTEAGARGMRVRAAALGDAERVLGDAAADAVLVDVGDEDGAGWALLPQVTRRLPGVALLVATDRDSLLDRVRVLQLGARVFLEKPFTAGEALDAVARVLPQRGERGQTRVLAVDDDPQILAAVRTLLEPQRVEVHTLDSPLRFWNTLRQVQPDVLILDVDMPFLDGIELCRVVRADHRWSGLPILFLTARTDAETILRVFAAGADDYVTKPVVGPELIARLRTRLTAAGSRR